MSNPIPLLYNSICEKWLPWYYEPDFLFALRIGDSVIDGILNEVSFSPRSTLVFGAFGTGKTLFSMQVAVNFVSETNQVYYIVTDGPFPSSRLFEIKGDRDVRNFFVVEIRELQEFISFLSRISSLPPNRPKLIIVDNLTSLTRFSYNLREISVELPKALHLVKLNSHTSLIFVAQVKNSPDSGLSKAALHPGLFYHGHFFDFILQLEKRDTIREMIFYSRFSKQSVNYQIQPTGIIHSP